MSIFSGVKIEGRTVVFIRIYACYEPVVFFPVSCHLGPKGPNGKIVLIRFVHVHKKYKTRVGDRQRKSGYRGILAQKVSVRPSARINYAPLSNLTMYTTGFKLNTAYAVNLCTRFLNLLSAIIRQFEIGLLTELSRL